MTHQGLFEFHIMPFGLTNAPSVFRELCSKYLVALVQLMARNLWKSMILFNVLIFSNTIEEHIDHLHKVANLKLKPATCHFL